MRPYAAAAASVTSAWPASNARLDGDGDEDDDDDEDDDGDEDDEDDEDGGKEDGDENEFRMRMLGRSNFGLQCDWTTDGPN